MRIAVVEFCGRGGMIHYAYQMCCGLTNAGAEVTLVTEQHYELHRLPHLFRLKKLLRLWESKPKLGVKAELPYVIRKMRRIFRGLIYYWAWLRLILFLQRERPDVVQFGDIRFASDYPFLLLMNALGHRMVDICHNIRPFALSGGIAGRFHLAGWERIIYNRIYRQFEVVVVHFETNRREFLSTFEVDSDRVITIPHGNQKIFHALADPDTGPAEIRKTLNLEPSEPVILLFGTLSRYKGVDTLVEAFAELRPVCPKARLVIAGYPLPDFDIGEVLSRAKQLGVEEDLRLWPKYIEADEVAAWMAMASVVAFPYRAIYQSGALQVALSFGAPVIVTAVGAMPEAVRDGMTGLVVPPDDVPALASAMRRVLSSPDFARGLGRRADEEAETRFDWQRIADQLLSRYRRPRSVRRSGLLRNKKEGWEAHHEL